MSNERGEREKMEIDRQGDRQVYSNALIDVFHWTDRYSSGQTGTQSHER